MNQKRINKRKGIESFSLRNCTFSPIKPCFHCSSRKSPSCSREMNSFRELSSWKTKIWSCSITKSAAKLKDLKIKSNKGMADDIQNKGQFQLRRIKSSWSHLVSPRPYPQINSASGQSTSLRDSQVRHAPEEHLESPKVTIEQNESQRCSSTDQTTVSAPFAVPRLSPLVCPIDDWKHKTNSNQPDRNQQGNKFGSQSSMVALLWARTPICHNQQGNVELSARNSWS